jgi:hypothetical protein
MGRGFYSPTTQTLNLFVSFRYDASSELTKWQEWFTWASEMLGIATEERFRLGQVVYVNSEPASSDVLGADVRVVNGAASELNHHLGLGVPNARIDIGNGNLGQPGKLVHELGHYVFDLWDEYSGPDLLPGTKCISDTTASFACVMQLAANSIQLPAVGSPRWPPPSNVVTEFCTNNHPTSPHRTTAPMTWQQAMNGKSCWETIAGLATLYGPISAPLGAPATPTVVPATGVPTTFPIPMIHATVLRRFVLLLDRSWSMAANNAIAGVRYAAHFWIDLESMLGAQVGNQLGAVSYASTPTPTVPLALIPLPPAPGYSAAHNAVNTALNPGGSTNITGAIDFGQSLFTGPLTGQTMLLFSDGLHNVGPGPSLSTLASRNTTIHTVSFGPDADRDLMFHIAYATRGSHHHVESPADASHTEFVINKALSEIASISHSDLIAAADAELLLTSGEESQIPQPEEPGSSDDLKFVAGMTTEQVEQSGNMFELEVFVENGVGQVTFVANHRGADNVVLYVLDPGGTPLGHVVGEFAAGEAHSTYTVVPHLFGIWRMRIRRLDVRGPRSVPVRLFAFADNPDLTVVVFGPELLRAVNEDVVLRAVANFPRTLTNVNIRIWPAGSPNQVQPFQEMAPGIGQYRCDLGSFGAPGSYPFVIEFVGDDDTIEALLSEEEEADERIPERRKTGPWVRRVERQIHVGPLPTGEDNDDDGLGTGCCGWLIRRLLQLCNRTRGTYRQARTQLVQRRQPKG